MVMWENQWLEREVNFPYFVSHTLADFWQQRLEGECKSHDGMIIRYVHFTHPKHDKVIVIVPGRIECYLKYPELIFDLFQCGYDVFVIDHRGQGLSGRLLNDPERGHVECFSDYVDDLALFWSECVQTAQYREVFALAHSMGCAILGHFLQRSPDAVRASVLVAPMTGIKLPMPKRLARRILDYTERTVWLRNRYVFGFGKWRAPPFYINPLTHSQQRYRYYQHCYTQHPQVRIGGPSFHWVSEALYACDEMLTLAPDWPSPLLVIQAEQDRVVDNESQNRFCQALPPIAQSGHEQAPLVMQGARHEILFEGDGIRAGALNAIVTFFAQHH